MKVDLLNHLGLKFNHKADTYEEWSKDREEILQKHHFYTFNLNEVKVLKKKHQIFVLDMQSYKKRVEQIVTDAQELACLQYNYLDSTNYRSQRICNHWNRLILLAHQREIALNQTEQVLEKLDALHLEFAKRAVPFNNWLDGALQDLMDLFIVRFIKEIQHLVDICLEFKTKMLDADKEQFKIVSLFQEIESIVRQYQIPGQTHNPYTTLTAKDISNKWHEVKQLLPKHDPSLKNEGIRDQIIENMCRMFAEKANIVGPWIERQIDSVAAIAVDMDSTFEEQLSKLSQYQMAVYLYKTHMEELEVIHQEIHKESVAKEDGHIPYIMEKLGHSWQMLNASIMVHIDQVENLIAVRDSKSISTEQLNRFRISFNTSDDCRIGKLKTNQLKSCLMTLGYHFTAFNGQESNFQRVVDILDPKYSGFVSFVDFIEFVTDKNSFNYCFEDIIESFRILSSYKPYTTAQQLCLYLKPDFANYCIERMKPYDGSDSVPGALDYVIFSKLLHEKRLKGNTG